MVSKGFFVALREDSSGTPSVHTYKPLGIKLAGLNDSSLLDTFPWKYKIAER